MSTFPSHELDVECSFKSIVCAFFHAHKTCSVPNNTISINICNESIQPLYEQIIYKQGFLETDVNTDPDIFKNQASVKIMLNIV
jgi:hypothetical protein